MSHGVRYKTLICKDISFDDRMMWGIICRILSYATILATKTGDNGHWWPRRMLTTPIKSRGKGYLGRKETATRGRLEWFAMDY